MGQKTSKKEKENVSPLSRSVRYVNTGRVSSFFSFPDSTILEGKKVSIPFFFFFSIHLTDPSVHGQAETVSTYRATGYLNFRKGKFLNIYIATRPIAVRQIKYIPRKE